MMAEIKGKATPKVIPRRKVDSAISPLVSFEILTVSQWTTKPEIIHGLMVMPVSERLGKYILERQQAIQLESPPSR